MVSAAALMQGRLDLAKKSVRLPFVGLKRNGHRVVVPANSAPLLWSPLIGVKQSECDADTGFNETSGVMVYDFPPPRKATA